MNRSVFVCYCLLILQRIDTLKKALGANFLTFFFQPWQMSWLLIEDAWMQYHATCFLNVATMFSCYCLILQLSFHPRFKRESKCVRFDMQNILNFKMFWSVESDSHTGRPLSNVPFCYLAGVRIALTGAKGTTSCQRLLCWRKTSLCCFTLLSNFKPFTCIYLHINHISWRCLCLRWWGLVNGSSGSDSSNPFQSFRLDRGHRGHHQGHRLRRTCELKSCSLVWAVCQAELLAAVSSPKLRVHAWPVLLLKEFEFFCFLWFWIYSED